MQHHSEEYSLSVDRLREGRTGSGAKWLSCYRPSVNLNASEYHFVSEPKSDRHQKVSVKNS